MHTTNAGNQIKALRRQARQRIKGATLARKAAQVVPEAKDIIKRIENEAASTLAEADGLLNAARLEDLHLWKMEKEVVSKKGKEKDEYWMASWRRGWKVHNEYVRNLQELNRETALGKARRIKAKDLGINKSSGTSD